MRIVKTTVLLVSLLASAASAQDWPALRGVDGRGSLMTDHGVLKTTSEVQFKTRWKKTLGSGYSSVIVAQGNVVTMYTDGTDDLVACLNASDGELIWQFKTGPKFKGENGSFDGPLSTPLIDNGKVYAINATGQIFCLSLDEGEPIWSYDLPKETEVRQPLYGFVTSPILVEGTLIVQVGAKDKTLMGFDPESGAVRWAVGNDGVSSQTPAVVSVSGKSVVLAAGRNKLLGVNPSSGDIYFEFAHEGGNGSAVTPVEVSDGDVLLTLDDRFSKTVTLNPQSDDQIHVSPKWQERSIKNTYNIPVLSNGGVFAYSTRILTCVDPETGRAFWKTREPGDGFLISVDNHIIINTKKGSLHLAKADKTGYVELATLDLFEDLVWSVPAYSDNSVFVRSLGEIARVDIVASDSGDAIVEGSKAVRGASFSKFIDSLGGEGLTDTARMEKVDAWMAEQKEFPVIEDGIAHFVYRGPETDVALAGDFLGARQEKEMIHVAGTDLFYQTIALPSDQRTNYCFLVNFKPVLDTLNSRQMTSTMYAGEMEFAVRLRGQEPLKMSWFAMPDWKLPSYLKELDSVNVDLEEREVPDVTGGALITSSKIEVLLPPGYQKNKEQRYPVAYIIDGALARERGEMDRAMQQLYSGDTDAEPAIIVFLNLSPNSPTFADQLGSKVVPFVDENYRTRAQRESRMVLGFGFSGTPALVSVANQNDLFGCCAVQSPLAFAAAEKMILESMSVVELPTKVHLQWGRFDMYNPHENWDLRSGSKKLFDELGKIDNLQVTGGMVNDSTDWSSWKNRYAEIFALLMEK